MSQPTNVSTPVPFPQPLSVQPSQQQPQQQQPQSPTSSPTTPARRARTSTNASIASASSRLRSASIKLIEADPPPGMWAATGSVTSKAPSLAEIRRGSFGSSGWNEEVQRQQRPGPGKRTNTTSTTSPATLGSEPFPALAEEDGRDKELNPGLTEMESSPKSALDEEGKVLQQPHNERRYSNGYVPPPKVPWTTATVVGLKAFWKWFLTIPGFLITLYGLNVVAWGGMLFLLLCNASPAMCHPSCNDIQSPRRIWIEIDSQILNSLFCVTGFGLAPWRFRDLYWWANWRIGRSKRSEAGMRRLAGIHRGWFRLPGSDSLPGKATAQTVSPEDPAVPIPHGKIPDPPPTGIHAPPTKGWKMDFVVWMNVWNTFFQIVLCFYMWHYNRYDRPSWATGLFVALGCVVAGLGGIMMWFEGKNVKKVEGVPVATGVEAHDTDLERQSAQRQPVSPKA